MRHSPRSLKTTARLLASLVLVLGTLGLSVAATGSASADSDHTSITASGPLTTITATNHLVCAVHHSGEPEGVFYSDLPQYGISACATLVSFGGTTYGPENIVCYPDNSGCGGDLPVPADYAPVSQSAVTGSGTSGDPYQLVTVVTAGSGAQELRLTQTDSYVVGDEFYTTDVQVENIGTETVNGVLDRAADCNLESDNGFGATDEESGSVSCVSEENTGDGNVPGDLMAQWTPLTSGSHYEESAYPQFWDDVASMDNFPDTCQCNDDVDNGAGLSWAFSLDANDSQTFSEQLGFSDPNADLSVAQTDSPDPVNANNNVLYHVTVTNNGPDEAANVSLQDSLDPNAVFVSATPNNGGDTCEPSAGQVTCDMGTIGSGQSHTVDVVVQAPDTSEGTSITNVTDVSSDTNDPDPDNNHSEESTEVDPTGQGSGGGQGSSGYIPPSGGSLTTDPGTGPTPGDPTTITMKLGKGPGGAGSVDEIPDCSGNSDFTPCIGDIGDFQPPDGYTKAHVTIVYDKTAVMGGLAGNRKHWQVLYQKNDGTQVLPQCPSPKVPAEDVPCWTSIFRDASRDLHVKVLINSDPKLATRK